MSVILVLAGVGQLGLALASLAIPRVLGWRDELGKLRPLTRQVFWTYAAYIWVTNVCFGLVSALAPVWLLDGSPLSRALAAYITVYWGARLLVQFFYFDRSAAPAGKLFVIAEIGLITLFAALTLTYGTIVVA